MFRRSKRDEASESGRRKDDSTRSLRRTGSTISGSSSRRDRDEDDRERSKRHSRTSRDGHSSRTHHSPPESTISRRSVPVSSSRRESSPASRRHEPKTARSAVDAPAVRSMTGTRKSTSERATRADVASAPGIFDERGSGKRRSANRAVEDDEEAQMSNAVQGYPHNVGQSVQHPDWSQLQPNVPNQFPNQTPYYYALPSFNGPNPHGEAADYYGDQGESVAFQPGVRPSTPIIVGAEPHLMPASAEPAPPEETGQGAAAEFFASGNLNTANSSYLPVQNMQTISPRMSPSASPLLSKPSRPSKPSKKPATSTILGATTAAAIGASALGYKHSAHANAPSGSHAQYNSRPPTVSTYPNNNRPTHGSRPPLPIHHSSHQHEQYAIEEGDKGAFRSFVDWWNDYEDVRKMEEYTEYIGVCKYCFDRNSSPTQAPRHHNPRRMRSRESFENIRVDKQRRYQGSSIDRPVQSQKRNATWLGAGLGAYGIAKFFGAGSDSEALSDGEKRQRRTNSETIARRRSREQMSNAAGSSSLPHTRRSYSEQVTTTPEHSTVSLDRSEREAALSATAAGAGVIVGSKHGTHREGRNHEGPGAPIRDAFEESRHRPLSKIDEHDSIRTSQGTRPDQRRRRRSSPSSSSVSSRSSDKVGFFGRVFGTPKKSSRKLSAHRRQRRHSGSSSDDFLVEASVSPARIARQAKSKSKSSNRPRRSSDERAKLALAGLGTAAAALAAHEAGKGRVANKHGRDSGHHGLAPPPERVHQVSRDQHEEGWESASEEGNSEDSALAFGGGHLGQHKSAHSSAESLSSAASGAGTDKWNWRWGPNRRHSPSHRELSQIDPLVPVVASSTVTERSGDKGLANTMRPSDHTLRRASTEPLRVLDPMPDQDVPGRRTMPEQDTSFSPRPLVRARTDDLPLKQPQPIPPIQIPPVKAADFRPPPLRRVSFADAPRRPRPTSEPDSDLETPQSEYPPRHPAEESNLSQAATTRRPRKSPVPSPRPLDSSSDEIGKVDEIVNQRGRRPSAHAKEERSNVDTPAAAAIGASVAGALIGAGLEHRKRAENDRQKDSSHEEPAYFSREDVRSSAPEPVLASTTQATPHVGTKETFDETIPFPRLEEDDQTRSTDQAEGTRRRQQSESPPAPKINLPSSSSFEMRRPAPEIDSSDDDDHSHEHSKFHPDFFKKRKKAAEYARNDKEANEVLEDWRDKYVHDQTSASDFWKPEELRDGQQGKASKTTNPDATGGDFANFPDDREIAAAPSRNVPRLELIAPTPPRSESGLSPRSRSPSPLRFTPTEEGTRDVSRVGTDAHPAEDATEGKRSGKVTNEDTIVKSPTSHSGSTFTEERGGRNNIEDRSNGDIVTPSRQTPYPTESRDTSDFDESHRSSPPKTVPFDKVTEGRTSSRISQSPDREEQADTAAILSLSDRSVGGDRIRPEDIPLEEVRKSNKAQSRWASFAALASGAAAGVVGKVSSSQQKPEANAEVQGASNRAPESKTVSLEDVTSTAPKKSVSFQEPQATIPSQETVLERAEEGRHSSRTEPSSMPGAFDEFEGATGNSDKNDKLETSNSRSRVADANVEDEWSTANTSSKKSKKQKKRDKRVSWEAEDQVYEPNDSRGNGEINGDGSPEFRTASATENDRSESPTKNRQDIPISAPRNDPTDEWDTQPSKKSKKGKKQNSRSVNFDDDEVGRPLETEQKPDVGSRNDYGEEAQSRPGLPESVSTDKRHSNDRFDSEDPPVSPVLSKKDRKKQKKKSSKVQWGDDAPCEDDGNKERDVPDAFAPFQESSALETGTGSHNIADKTTSDPAPVEEYEEIIEGAIGTPEEIANGMVDAQDRPAIEQRMGASPRPSSDPISRSRRAASSPESVISKHTHQSADSPRGLRIHSLDGFDVLEDARQSPEAPRSANRDIDSFGEGVGPFEPTDLPFFGRPPSPPSDSPPQFPQQGSAGIADASGSPHAPQHQRQPSSTAIPLRFRKPSGSPTFAHDGGVPTADADFAVPPSTPIRSRPSPRPASTEFKSTSEFRPLYLVERNAKVSEPQESLPSLPSSNSDSRTPSIHESSDNEAYESALESPNVPPSVQSDYFVPSIRTGHDEEYLGSGQTTPRAHTASPEESFRASGYFDTLPQETLAQEAPFGDATDFEPASTRRTTHSQSDSTASTGTVMGGIAAVSGAAAANLPRRRSDEDPTMVRTEAKPSPTEGVAKSFDYMQGGVSPSEQLRLAEEGFGGPQAIDAEGNVPARLANDMSEDEQVSTTKSKSKADRKREKKARKSKPRNLSAFDMSSVADAHGAEMQSFESSATPSNIATNNTLEEPSFGTANELPLGGVERSSALASSKDDEPAARAANPFTNAPSELTKSQDVSSLIAVETSEPSTAIKDEFPSSVNTFKPSPDAPLQVLELAKSTSLPELDDAELSTCTLEDVTQRALSPALSFHDDPKSHHLSDVDAEFEPSEPSKDKVYWHHASTQFDDRQEPLSSVPTDETVESTQDDATKIRSTTEESPFQVFEPKVSRREKRRAKKSSVMQNEDDATLFQDSQPPRVDEAVFSERPLQDPSETAQEIDSSDVAYTTPSSGKRSKKDKKKAKKSSTFEIDLWSAPLNQTDEIPRTSDADLEAAEEGRAPSAASEKQSKDALDAATESPSTAAPDDTSEDFLVSSRKKSKKNKRNAKRAGTFDSEQPTQAVADREDFTRDPSTYLNSGAEQSRPVTPDVLKEPPTPETKSFEEAVENVNTQRVPDATGRSPPTQASEAQHDLADAATRSDQDDIDTASAPSSSKFSKEKRKSRKSVQFSFPDEATSQESGEDLVSVQDATLTAGFSPRRDRSNSLEIGKSDAVQPTVTQSSPSGEMADMGEQQETAEHSLSHSATVPSDTDADPRESDDFFAPSSKKSKKEKRKAKQTLGARSTQDRNDIEKAVLPDFSISETRPDAEPESDGTSVASWALAAGAAGAALGAMSDPASAENSREVSPGAKFNERKNSFGDTAPPQSSKDSGERKEDESQESRSEKPASNPTEDDFQHAIVAGLKEAGFDTNLSASMHGLTTTDEDTNFASSAPAAEHDNMSSHMSYDREGAAHKRSAADEIIEEINKITTVSSDEPEADLEKSEGIGKWSRPSFADQGDGAPKGPRNEDSLKDDAVAMGENAVVSEVPAENPELERLPRMVDISPLDESTRESADQIEAHPNIKNDAAESQTADDWLSKSLSKKDKKKAKKRQSAQLWQDDVVQEPGEADEYSTVSSAFTFSSQQPGNSSVSEKSADPKAQFSIGRDFSSSPTQNEQDVGTVVPAEQTTEPADEWPQSASNKKKKKKEAKKKRQSEIWEDDSAEKDLQPQAVSEPISSNLIARDDSALTETAEPQHDAVDTRETNEGGRERMQQTESDGHRASADTQDVAARSDPNVEEAEQWAPMSKKSKKAAKKSEKKRRQSDQSGSVDPPFEEIAEDIPGNPQASRDNAVLSAPGSGKVEDIAGSQDTATEPTTQSMGLAASSDSQIDNAAAKVVPQPSVANRGEEENVGSKVRTGSESSGAFMVEGKKAEHNSRSNDEFNQILDASLTHAGFDQASLFSHRPTEDDGQGFVPANEEHALEYGNIQTQNTKRSGSRTPSPTQMWGSSSPPKRSPPSEPADSTQQNQSGTFDDSNLPQATAKDKRGPNTFEDAAIASGIAAIAVGGTVLSRRDSSKTSKKNKKKKKGVRFDAFEEEESSQAQDEPASDLAGPAIERENPMGDYFGSFGAGQDDGGAQERIADTQPQLEGGQHDISSERQPSFIDDEWAPAATSKKAKRSKKDKRASSTPANDVVAAQSIDGGAMNMPRVEVTTPPFQDEPSQQFEVFDPESRKYEGEGRREANDYDDMDPDFEDAQEQQGQSPRGQRRGSRANLADIESDIREAQESLGQTANEDYRDSPTSPQYEDFESSIKEAVRPGSNQGDEKAQFEPFPSLEDKRRDTSSSPEPFPQLGADTAIEEANVRDDQQRDSLADIEADIEEAQVSEADFVNRDRMDAQRRSFAEFEEDLQEARAGQSRFPDEDDRRRSLSDMDFERHEAQPLQEDLFIDSSQRIFLSDDKGYIEEAQPAHMQDLSEDGRHASLANIDREATEVPATQDLAFSGDAGRESLTDIDADIREAQQAAALENGFSSGPASYKKAKKGKKGRKAQAPLDEFSSIEERRASETGVDAETMGARAATTKEEQEVDWFAPVSSKKGKKAKSNSQVSPAEDYKLRAGAQRASTEIDAKLEDTQAATSKQAQDDYWVAPVLSGKSEGNMDNQASLARDDASAGGVERSSLVDIDAEIKETQAATSVEDRNDEWAASLPSKKGKKGKKGKRAQSANAVDQPPGPEISSSSQAIPLFTTDTPIADDGQRTSLGNIDADIKEAQAAASQEAPEDDWYAPVSSKKSKKGKKAKRTQSTDTPDETQQRFVMEDAAKTEQALGNAEAGMGDTLMQDANDKNEQEMREAYPAPSDAIDWEQRQDYFGRVGGMERSHETEANDEPAPPYSPSQQQPVLDTGSPVNTSDNAPMPSAAVLEQRQDEEVYLTNQGRDLGEAQDEPQSTNATEENEDFSIAPARKMSKKDKKKAKKSQQTAPEADNEASEPSQAAPSIGNDGASESLFSARNLGRAEELLKEGQQTDEGLSRSESAHEEKHNHLGPARTLSKKDKNKIKQQIFEDDHMYESRKDDSIGEMPDQSVEPADSIFTHSDPMDTDQAVHDRGTSSEAPETLGEEQTTAPAEDEEGDMSFMPARKLSKKEAKKQKKAQSVSEAALPVAHDDTQFDEQTTALLEGEEDSASSMPARKMSNKEKKKQKKQSLVSEAATPIADDNRQFDEPTTSPIEKEENSMAFVPARESSKKEKKKQKKRQSVFEAATPGANDDAQFNEPTSNDGILGNANTVERMLEKEGEQRGNSPNFVAPADDWLNESPDTPIGKAAPPESTTKSRESSLFKSPPSHREPSFTQQRDFGADERAEAGLNETTLADDHADVGSGGSPSMLASDRSFEPDDEDSPLSVRRRRSRPLEVITEGSRETSPSKHATLGHVIEPERDSGSSSALSERALRTRRGSNDLRRASMSPSGSELANVRKAYIRSPVSATYSTASGDLVRPSSAMSSHSRAGSTTSNHSLRRIDDKTVSRSISSDLRAAAKRDASGEKARASDDSQTPLPVPVPLPFDYEPLKGTGVKNTRERRQDMSDGGVFEAFGDARGSPRSPTRPPSVRKRQSLQVLELQNKLDEALAENDSLKHARSRSQRGLDDTDATSSLQKTLQARDIQINEKDLEIRNVKIALQTLQSEIERLKEHNSQLQTANDNLGEDVNLRYASLQQERDEAHSKWQASTRQLGELEEKHGKLSAGMEAVVRQQIAAALDDRNAEIRSLRAELETASDRIESLQQQAATFSGSDDYLNTRDEDYFDNACQQLCRAVHAWVMRFSKFSDNRKCRLSSEIHDDTIETRLDNAMLDGTDVDDYLADRVLRRDVFMSVVMTMVWEYVFTRYLFGMDREQRQKLKSLEKILSEVGPPKAVAQWRATTLSLLSRREAFFDQRSQDTDAVVNEIMKTLGRLLPPPGQQMKQVQDSLRNVMILAVDLSIEMRTQRAEYIMLPPLRPEFDTNGDLAKKVFFNAALMNEKSEETASNEELEEQAATVRTVLFPLVVKRGNDNGETDEEIVVHPAQVLVSRPNKRRSGVMSNANRSTVSIAPPAVLEPPPRKISNVAPPPKATPSAPPRFEDPADMV